MNRSLVSGIATMAGSLALAQSPAATAAEPRVERELHTLIAIHGDVLVKRKGWKDYAAVGFGTALNRGDLVRLAAAARATVACADLSVRELPTGRISGVPCTEGAQPVLIYEGSLLNTTRATAPANVPVVISPRRTRLLSRHPTLRWMPMDGATRYKVRVSGPGLDWSADVNDATSVSYPADAPALQPGVTYKVSVVSGGHSSDELAEPGLGFTLLDAAAERAVHAQGERIRALKLSSDATQLLSAQLYTSHGLHAETLERLEALVKARPAAAIWLAIAREYQAVGLNELAEQGHIKAVQLARAAGDIEGQALARQALGYLYRDAFGLPNDARKSFQSALEMFQKLGATTAAAEVQRALADQ